MGLMKSSFVEVALVVPAYGPQKPLASVVQAVVVNLPVAAVGAVGAAEAPAVQSNTPANTRAVESFLEREIMIRVFQPSKRPRSHDL